MVSTAARMETGMEEWPLPRICDELDKIEIEPRKTALISVDLTYFCAHPDYGNCKMAIGMGQEDRVRYFLDRVEHTVVPNTQKLLNLFRQHGLFIVHLTIGQESPDGSDLNLVARARADQRARIVGGPFWPIKGSREHSIMDEVKPLPGETVINKMNNSPFNTTNIDQILRERGIEALVIAGVVTNGCVEMTARDASDRGYLCTLVEDACAAYNAHVHVIAIDTFATTYGRVKSTQEIISELQGKLQKAPSLLVSEG